MQQSMMRYALAAAVGLVVGFFAGKEYFQYRMMQVWSGEVASLGVSLSTAPRANAVTFSNEQAVAPKDFASLNISAGRVSPPERFGEPTLHVTVHNTSEKTFAAIDFGCSVKSDGRKVAWADCGQVFAKISGGLAPGETRELSGSSFAGMYAVFQALKDHPEAKLGVFVTDTTAP